MATGIVSIGLFLWKWTVPAVAFPGVNVFFYLVLLAILIARIIRFPKIVWDDLHHIIDL